MLESLNIVSDEKLQDFIEDIESSFGVKFTKEEIGRWGCASDVYYTLWENLEAAGNNSVKCASAMAFYKLRAKIREFNPKAKISPNTALIESGLWSHRKLKQSLETPNM